MGKIVFSRDWRRCVERIIEMNGKALVENAEKIANGMPENVRSVSISFDILPDEIPEINISYYFGSGYPVVVRGEECD